MLENDRHFYGSRRKFNARIVAGSCFQILDQEFVEDYASVIDFTLVILDLNIALMLGWFLRHLM